MLNFQGFFLIIVLLLWPNSALQSSIVPNSSNLSECTLSPAINELLYAPSVCNEEWFGCSAQTWLALNGVPFDSALWTIAHVTDSLVTIQNEGKLGGYLTTLDGEFVVSSSSLGVESRSWIVHRIRQGLVAIENAKFRGKFLVTSGSAGGMSRAVSLDPKPQQWHLACRADKLI